MIFTKRGKCINIVEIRFGLLMGKFRQFLTELFAAPHTIVAGYGRFTFLLEKCILMLKTIFKTQTYRSTKVVRLSSEAFLYIPVLFSSSQSLYMCVSLYK